MLITRAFICWPAQIIWCISFCYTSIVSLVFQKLLLPLMPSLHAGSGLLKNDASFYHQQALIMTENINKNGWSEWAIWSQGVSATGNVGILSALYAYFAPNPAFFIAINSALQATASVTLYFIGRELWLGKVGHYAGLISAVLFVIFPSAISWYSQPLKDCFVISGMFLVVYSWIGIVNKPAICKKYIKFLPYFCSGVLLITIVKPYVLKLLLVALGLILLGLMVFSFKIFPHRLYVLIFCILSWVIVAGVFAFVKQFPSTDSNELYAKADEIAFKWEWQNSPWLTNSIQNGLETMAKTRVGFIQFNITSKAGSIIDEDRAPNSVLAMVEYLPRAIQIGLFAPFPNSWLQKTTIERLVAALETTVWYVIFPGLFFAFYLNCNVRLLVVAFFALFFITIYSFVHPNVGTLYRFRFPYEFLLIVIAIGGWLTFLSKISLKRAFS